MKTTTKYWFLEDFNLFKKLGLVNMMQICEIFEMNYITKGSGIEICNKGIHSVFFVKKGTLKIVNKANNHVKYIVKRGNIFGELALIDQKETTEDKAYALEDAIICHIEAQQMLQLMEKHKSLKNEILKIYGSRIQKLERKLSDLLYKDSYTRIKEFIIDHIKDFGEENQGEYITNNLLSHKEIASLTNTSRQTVSNVLSNLRKKGIINYDSKKMSF